MDGGGRGVGGREHMGQGGVFCSPPKYHFYFNPGCRVISRDLSGRHALTKCVAVELRYE